MKVRLTAKYLLMTFSALLTSALCAEDIFDIPVMDDAIVFANFNDNTPAVIKIFPSNYVESVSEPKSIAASADKIHASRQARLDQMKRQSIFAPPAHKENAQDKVVHHATINPKMVVDHTNYTNDGGAHYTVVFHGVV